MTIEDTQRIYRQAVGLSQTDLAMLAGVRQESVNRWEKIGDNKQDVVDDLRDYATEIREAVAAYAGGVVVRYEAEDWPDAAGLPGLFTGWHHGMHEAYVRACVLGSADTLRVARFDAADYRAWRGDAEDSHALRAAWAQKIIEQ